MIETKVLHYSARVKNGPFPVIARHPSVLVNRVRGKAPPTGGGSRVARNYREGRTFRPLAWKGDSCPKWPFGLPMSGIRKMGATQDVSLFSRLEIHYESVRAANP